MSLRTGHDPLAGTRPAFLPDQDTPIDPVRRERDLRAILAHPRPVVRPAPRRLSVASLVAAGAVVVAVVIGTTTASEVPGQDESPRAVLLAVADATATTAAPTPGRYWHVRQHSTSVEAMWPGRDHDAYLVVVDSGAESWTSRTGADRSVDVSQLDLRTRALTERDQAEWDKAGNPVGIPDAEPTPGAPPPPPMPRTVPPSAQWLAGAQVFRIGGVETSVAEVLALPTDGARLKEFLLERFRANPPTGGEPTEETEWLMWEADTLIGGRVPTTPGTRAAAYEMLAGLPGFRVMGGGEVPEGMVGVAREVRTGWNYTIENALVEWQVIIDPDTGSLREWRLVLVEPGSEERRLPAGTVIHAVTVEQVGWVDTDPIVPDDADQFGTVR
jgi:hypothetical protein